ncbi:hypothetical protein GCM10009836_67690 [Pseudonocardia ailaonensis]|uniref:Uncharacterized protein n=1 Tax=Pseudonocardia ailaonensis TaxID=367279 RepID=A0ABN2NP34_9PSEU
MCDRGPGLADDRREPLGHPLADRRAQEQPPHDLPDRDRQRRSRVPQPLPDDGDRQRHVARGHGLGEGLDVPAREAAVDADGRVVHREPVERQALRRGVQQEEPADAVPERPPRPGRLQHAAEQRDVRVEVVLAGRLGVAAVGVHREPLRQARDGPPVVDQPDPAAVYQHQPRTRPGGADRHHPPLGPNLHDDLLL